MNVKINLVATVMVIAGAVSAATSTPAGWTDDFQAAKKQAAAEKKLLLVDFSGSDWCGWCKKLDKEVFAQPEFLEGVKKDFVLVMVDSPSDKTLLSRKAADQNPKLVKKYGVHGFPTVLIMDSDGTVLEKTGYRAGGPRKYLEHLAEIKKFSAKLIALKRDIAGMSRGSPARLAKIDAAFTDSGKDALRKNADLIKELLENDPDGKYAVKYSFVKYRMPLDNKLQAIFSDLNGRFRKRINEVAGKGKRPSREQREQVKSEIDGYAVESMRKLLKETAEEQASAPEHAKKEYESFVKDVESTLKRIEGQGKNSF